MKTADKSGRSRILVLVGLIALLPSLMSVRPVQSFAQALSAATVTAASHGSPSPQAQMTHLPISFEVNRGQVNRRVAYLAHLPGAALFLTSSGSVLTFSQPEKSSHRSGSNSRDLLAPRLMHPTAAARTRNMTVGMRFEGANQHPTIVGASKLPGIVNYFIGNDHTKWHTNIPTYARIAYHNLYPGIDLVYYGKAGHLEYDWIVHPGANPDKIKLRVDGASRLSLDRQGNLRIGTGARSVLQQAPVFYQTTGTAMRRLVSGHYMLRGRDVRVSVGHFDRHRALIVDPTLVYSTYLGGSGGDGGYGIAVDSTGSAYVTGTTGSTDFPPQNAFQSASGGSYDAFVTKLAPSGSSLVYSTYLGGSGGDEGWGIAVDSTGNAYVTGYTQSTNFPVPNAFQSTLSGPQDAFVTKLAASGSSLVYSTYLGGNDNDEGSGIAVDSAGNVYVTGTTQSTNFPVQSAFQSALSGGTDTFVTKLAATGSSLVYSTYLGAPGFENGISIAVDSAGSAYITGVTYSTDFPLQNAFQSTFLGGGDAFVTKLTPSGSSLVYSTYLGGNGADYGMSIAVDSTGSAYVTGTTSSTNFPLQNAFRSALSGDVDAFVTKLDTSGSSLVYSTYLGGTGEDHGYGIAVDSTGSAYVTGGASADFPLQNAIQSTLSGDTDAFVTKLAASGSSLVYSTYLGGDSGDHGQGIAVDGAGSAYITGNTDSTNFPVPNAFQSTLSGPQDAFVARFPALDAPNPTPTATAPATTISTTITQISDRIHTLFSTSATDPTFPTIDGNTLKLSVTLANTGTTAITAPLMITDNTDGASVTLPGTFVVASDGTVGTLGTTPLTVAAGPATTVTVTLTNGSDGMAWDSSGSIVTKRYLSASFDGVMSLNGSFEIKPRPVVLVHGLNDSYKGFADWYQAGGFLCSKGYPTDVVTRDEPYVRSSWCGYPVDTMNTGWDCSAAPGARCDQDLITNTTLQNAQLLATYVDSVRLATGADKVDLVAHSMGGLISRLYIGKIMTRGTVSRLIMLGTPNNGSNAGLLGTIGDVLFPVLGVLFRLAPQPATWENSRQFVGAVTNLEATDRKGAHFYGIAGNLQAWTNNHFCPTLDGWPSDQVVNMHSTETLSADSPTYIGLGTLPHYREMQVSHALVGVANTDIGFTCAGAQDGVEQISPQVFNQVFTDMLSNRSMASVSTGTNALAAHRVHAHQTVSDTPAVSPVLAGTSVSLAPGQSTTLTVQSASGAPDLTALVGLNLGTTDTRPTITLTSPSGAVSTPSSLQSGVYYADLTTATSPVVPGLQFYVQNPEAGTWTLTVTNPSDSNQNPLNCVPMFTTNDTAGLAVSPQTDAQSYDGGQTVTLTTQVTQVNADGTRTAITGNNATVTALMAPLATSGDIPPPSPAMTLYDDGAHSDGAANDGVYGATFTAPQQPGIYGIKMTVTVNGQQRIEPLVFRVKDRPTVSTVWNTQQYTLTGSDGSTWVPIDGTTLTKSFTPMSDSTAILSGNSDLWTSSAGYNQDLGIWISGGTYGSGQVVAWKESGGFAGTFSPNAAYVHTVLPLQAGVAYTMQLVWKSNKPDPGTIWAGAGPIGGNFSPTRLTAEVVPVTSSTTIASTTSTQQYTLTSSDGSTWMPMDGTNLSQTITPSTDSTVTLSGNSDLWTSSAGYNQDLGIWVAGGTYGSGQVVAWKESGGFAGTFSPNAAFVHTVLPLQAGTAYMIKLVWKSNKPDPGTIWAGAGPIGGNFSPTRLTAEVVPSGSTTTITTTSSTQQYTSQNSDGSTWVPVDGTNLAQTITPTTPMTAILSGNSDLWTSSAGYNQDIGIWVSGGTYGSGQVVAWKESGGFAGTFSPNAAFVQTVLSLQANTTYTVELVWKSNKSDPGTIWAGAGPISRSFSPTRMTAELTP